MKIDHPRQQDLPALRQLWQQAFGDPQAFLDLFFQTGFSAERCRCVFLEDRPVSALYWFDGFTPAGKVAYLYAIATEKAYRGKGLCTALMDDTHRLLRQQGYGAACLEPAEKALEGFYGAMGYRPFGSCGRIRGRAAGMACAQPVTAEEFTRLRRQYLPRGAVEQPGAAARFLEGFARLYRGEGFLAVCDPEQPGAVWEFLGDVSQFCGFLAFLGAKQGWAKIPGGKERCAVMLPLREDFPEPSYLGLTMG